MFSAEDPDSLRGPQFAAAWADEFCAWRDGGEVLAMVRMGLRLPLRSAPSPLGDGEGDREAVEGQEARAAGPSTTREDAGGPPPRRESDGEDCAPRLCVTTTPRPTAALKALRAEASCRQSHAPTQDNAANLAPAFLEGLQALYGGTRRAAQELEGLVVEPEGGLFTAEMMSAAREETTTSRGSSSPKGGSPYEKIVVAVDPTATMSGNACGIVVVARAGERAVVLADRSARGCRPRAGREGLWRRRASSGRARSSPRSIRAGRWCGRCWRRRA
ncbi:hypothetical protein [Brevundimonas goettingensis]|uniref:hypothetical protein n=1 Tax=Brevundimonas goettingensis TaxID=2774190 RepID=UPI00384D6667